MPLYEMLCIARHVSDYNHIRLLVSQSATHIMNNGGVVRKINSWGTRTLPQKMSRHGSPQTLGDYWTMHFDTSPRTLKSLNGILRADPRVIRWTILKLGDKVEEMAVKGEKINIPEPHKPSIEDIVA